MKKTEKMIHQNIRFRSRIDTFLVSIEEFPSPSKVPTCLVKAPTNCQIHSDFVLTQIKVLCYLLPLQRNVKCSLGDKSFWWKILL